MSSTNWVKWDDTNNRLTAYCTDDSGETEIGPVKWDDANDKLELNCDSTDFQVKWNDATDKLEAQGVSDDCCVPPCLDPCVTTQSPSMWVTFNDIVDCPGSVYCAANLNGNTFALSASYLPTYYGYDSASIDITFHCTGGLAHRLHAYSDYGSCFISADTATCLPELRNNDFHSPNCDGSSVDGYNGTGYLEPY